MLTERELEEVTAVFKSFETGLREATIDPKVQFIFIFAVFIQQIIRTNLQDLHRAMQRLGLNPTEQEVLEYPSNNDQWYDKKMCSDLFW